MLFGRSITSSNNPFRVWQEIAKILYVALLDAQNIVLPNFEGIFLHLIMEKTEWYAIAFNEWIFDNRIDNELKLLLYISSLCAQEWYCFAGNLHFAEKFKEHEVTISRKVKNLEKLWHIKIEYERRWCEIIKRKIRLAKILTDDKQNCLPTINENVKDNITSINNTNYNISDFEKIADENSVNVYPLFLYYFLKLWWKPSKWETVEWMKQWAQTTLTEWWLITLDDMKQAMREFYRYWETRKWEKGFWKKNWKTTLLNSISLPKNKNKYATNKK